MCTLEVDPILLQRSAFAMRNSEQQAILRNVYHQRRFMVSLPVLNIDLAHRRRLLRRDRQGPSVDQGIEMECEDIPRKEGKILLPVMWTSSASGRREI
uniref:Uncharacterized protein n=1 Tax=Steinernema glaseri TaxID=37863 RepID=A0A1I7ZPR5_9BILA